MTYKVLNTFKEKEHGGTVYQKGDVYPKDGFEANAKRVEFLQKKHPEYGVAFLETPKDEPKTAPKKATRAPKKAAESE